MTLNLLKGLPCNPDKGESWFLDKNYYPVLADLAQKLNPKSILEIGVRLGYSAISFLSKTQATEYMGLDCQDYIATSNSGAAQNFEFYRNVSGKQFVFELLTINTQSITSLDFLSGRTFDMVHVDGDHTQRGALNDLKNFWNVVNVGGHMLVDDSIHIPEVYRAIQIFLPMVNEPNYNVANLRGTWVIEKTKPLTFPIET